MQYLVQVHAGVPPYSSLWLLSSGVHCSETNVRWVSPKGFTNLGSKLVIGHFPVQRELKHFAVYVLRKSRLEFHYDAIQEIVIEIFRVGVIPRLLNC